MKLSPTFRNHVKVVGVLIATLLITAACLILFIPPAALTVALFLWASVLHPYKGHSRFFLGMAAGSFVMAFMMHDALDYYS